MSNQDLLNTYSKIKKLLALSTSPNIHEAALASQRAAEIMTRYQISEAEISLISLDSLSDDSVSEYGLSGIDDPIADCRSSPRKKIHWRVYIAQACARVCSCSVFWRGGAIRVIGREKDVQTTRYLYGLISSQIDPLAESCYKSQFCIVDLDEDEPWTLPHSLPNKKKWMHAFRLGCAKEIKRRMLTQLKETIRDQHNNPYALMVIKNRLAEVRRYEESLDMKPTPDPDVNDYEGYVSGVKAAIKVNTGSSSKGGLPSSKQMIGDG